MARKRKYNKITYTPMHPEKYVGKYPIIARSTWEASYMRFLDIHQDVLEWAWEPVQIPYRDPITGKQKIYVPDGLVTFIDAKRAKKTLLIEIKPAHEQFETHARGELDRMAILKNQAKWSAAAYWCQRRGIEFMILNEMNLFNGKNAKPTKPTLINGNVDPMKKKAIAKRKAIAKKKASMKKTKGSGAKAPKRPVRPKRPARPARPKRTR